MIFRNSVGQGSDMGRPNEQITLLNISNTGDVGDWRCSGVQPDMIATTPVETELRLIILSAGDID